MSLLHRVAAAATIGVLGVGTLTGCGGSSSGTGGTPTQGGYPSGRTGGAPGGFSFDQADLKKIRTCLKAAGLASDLPTGRPSGYPSGRPSGYPSGYPSDRPSYSPGARPSGGPGAGFRDPQVQAALQACGITFPNRPTAAPSQ